MTAAKGVTREAACMGVAVARRALGSRTIRAMSLGVRSERARLGAAVAAEATGKDSGCVACRISMSKTRTLPIAGEA